MNSFTITLALAGLTTAIESQFFDTFKGHGNSPTWANKDDFTFDFMKEV